MPSPLLPAAAPKLASLTLIGTLVYSAAPSLTLAADIKVFAARSISLSTQQDATIVDLDAASRIEGDLSDGLSSNQQRAETIARRRLQEGGRALQRDLAAAWQGVADAWSLGVTTLPAVVVDRRYVIYGEPDVAKAVARIEAYRRERE